MQVSSPCYGTESCLHKNGSEFALLENTEHLNNLSSDCIDADIYSDTDKSSLEEYQTFKKIKI